MPGGDGMTENTEKIIKKADQKLRTGILKLTGCGLVLAGVMACHIPVLGLVAVSVVIAPTAFVGISEFKQGYDLKKQLISPIEPEEEIIENNDTFTNITSTTKKDIYSPNLFYPEGIKRNNYQKVKKR